MHFRVAAARGPRSGPGFRVHDLPEHWARPAPGGTAERTSAAAVTQPRAPWNVCGSETESLRRAVGALLYTGLPVLGGLCKSAF